MGGLGPSREGELRCWGAASCPSSTAGPRAQGPFGPGRPSIPHRQRLLVMADSFCSGWACLVTGSIHPPRLLQHLRQVSATSVLAGRPSKPRRPLRRPQAAPPAAYRAGCCLVCSQHVAARLLLAGSCCCKLLQYVMVRFCECTSTLCCDGPRCRRLAPAPLAPPAPFSH